MSYKSKEDRDAENATADRDYAESQSYKAYEDGRDVRFDEDVKPAVRPDPIPVDRSPTTIQVTKSDQQIYIDAVKAEQDKAVATKKLVDADAQRRVFVTVEEAKARDSKAKEKARQAAEAQRIHDAKPKVLTNRVWDNLVKALAGAKITFQS